MTEQSSLVMNFIQTSETKGSRVKLTYKNKNSAIEGPETGNQSFCGSKPTDSITNHKFQTTNPTAMFFNLSSVSLNCSPSPRAFSRGLRTVCKHITEGQHGDSGRSVYSSAADVNRGRRPRQNKHNYSIVQRLPLRLTVTRQDKKFLIYGIQRRFITVCTEAFHRSLSIASSVHSPQSCPTLQYKFE
jgi:hypothetical protein